MTIGTSLFARLTTEGFSRTQTQIASLQERVAAGTNDPRPSMDPVRASQLSAGKDLQARLDRFSDNAAAATDRLGVTDNVLYTVSGLVRQLHELSIQAANATLSDEGASGIRVEVGMLREELILAANARDASGQPLFAGYGFDAPFVDAGGTVEYRGDAGRTSLRVSESMTLTTSLNGADVFGTQDSGLFRSVDDLLASLSPFVRRGGADVRADGSALLQLSLPRSATEVAFTLSGPLGSADLKVTAVADVPGPMIDAINALSGETGISAGLAMDGASILLTSSGEIGLSNASRSDGASKTVALVQPLEGALATRGPMALTSDRLSPDRLVGAFADEVTNMAASRAEAGALARVAERQSETLAFRKLNLDAALSGLEDLDMAETITKLQTLLMTQEASQQAFVRIRSTGLFDYLR